MKLTKFGLVAALATVLSQPVVAQTTQMTPGKPTPQMTTPAPAPVPNTTVRPMTPAASGIVDINSASAEDLDRLPGVGKARANAIIKNRPYRGKDDLLGRHIVPPNVYNGIKDKIIAKQG